MQILITIGEDGRATAQVLRSETTAVERTAGDVVAIDAGAARTIENEPKAASAVTSTAIEAGAVDGGAAPAELQEGAPRGKAMAPPEAGPFEEAGAAPTIVDVFSAQPRRSMRASIH